MSKKKSTPKRRRRPNKTELPKGPLRFFFLARQGFVQRYAVDVFGDGIKRKVWPIAHAHEDANRLVDYLGLRDRGIRPAEIGTVSGETFEGHLRLASDEECEFICAIAGWNEEGTPLWNVMRLADIYPGPEGDR